MLSFLKPRLYIQLSPERVMLKNLKAGSVLFERPEMAVSGGAKPVILGVGSEARMAAQAHPGSTVVNPFAHPRSMVSDFTAAEQLLKELPRRCLGSGIMRLSPSVVMHPLGSPAGGFTQVENRAFRELGLGLGAAEVFVWNGRALTDDEVRTRDIPPPAGRWVN